jgi:hypothetical protein
LETLSHKELERVQEGKEKVGILFEEFHGFVILMNRRGMMFRILVQSNEDASFILQPRRVPCACGTSHVPITPSRSSSTPPEELLEGRILDVFASMLPL